MWGKRHLQDCSQVGKHLSGSGLLKHKPSMVTLARLVASNTVLRVMLSVSKLCWASIRHFLFKHIAPRDLTLLFCSPHSLENDQTSNWLWSSGYPFVGSMSSTSQILHFIYLEKAILVIFILLDAQPRKWIGYHNRSTYDEMGHEGVRSLIQKLNEISNKNVNYQQNLVK